MRKITLVMKNNKKKQVDVVRYFELNQMKYLIYTLGEVDTNNYQTLYVVREMKELGSPILQTIRDEQDWDVLKQKIREMIKGLKKGNTSMFTDLNSEPLEGLYVADVRIFKLAKPIVEILTIGEEPAPEASEEIPEVDTVSGENLSTEPVTEESVLPPSDEPTTLEEFAPIPPITELPNFEENELPEAQSNETEVVTSGSQLGEESDMNAKSQSVENQVDEVMPPEMVTEEPSNFENVFDQPVEGVTLEASPTIEDVEDSEEFMKNNNKKFRPTEEVNVNEQPFNRYILEVPPVPENVPIISLEEVYATLQKEMEQLRSAIEESLQNKSRLESEIVSLKAENAGQVSKIESFKEENKSQAASIASYKEETARQTAEINSLTTKNGDQASQIEKLNAEISDFEAKFKNIKGIID